MKKQIEKQIINDIKSALDEMDIDGMVKRMVTNKAVNEAVKRMVQEKLSQMIQDKAFMKIQKSMPIIDAWTNEKVQELLYSLGVK
jgi:hypothetical protein